MTKLIPSTPLILALALFGAACKKEEARKEPPKEPPKTDPAPVDKTAPAPASGDPTLGPIAGTYALDPIHSVVTFKIKHMNVSHTIGRFNKVEGSFTLDGDLAKTKVEIKVAADSVYTADKKRDDHLKSPDFLNAAQFPTITFASTAVKVADGRFEVTGDLDLHGVKKPVTATFELVGAGKHMMDDKQFLAGFTGDLTIKRTDFGMDKMVGPAGDDITLTIAVEGSKK
ncbi:MAG: YceI family protein [Kofleriaceae bacterium]